MLVLVLTLGLEVRSIVSFGSPQLQRQITPHTAEALSNPRTGTGLLTSPVHLAEGSDLGLRVVWAVWVGGLTGEELGAASVRTR